MRAVVLVGGFGTRLRPLTLDTPKQMLPVNRETMFERVVGRLGAAGVTEAVISLGFKPDRFTDAFPHGRCAGVALHYAIEPEPLDTAGAIAFAARDAGIDDTFLVVNGDVLTDVDHRDLMEAHRAFGAEATIHLIGVDDPSRFGVVVTADDGRVSAFVEKPAPGTAPANTINAGTYVMEPSAVERIAPGRKVSVERETFPAMVADGTLFGVHRDAYWIDAGTPSTYLRANLDLIDGTSGNEPAQGGGCSIATDVLAVHSVIGRGVTIGAGAELRDSVLMDGSSVGPGAKVHGSIVGRGAHVGAGAVITDGSVLGHGATLADGASLVADTEPHSSSWQ
ncbi:MAG: NDP-sugar synthase [Microthrixaceae bacterium]